MRIAYLHQYFQTPEDSGGTRSFEMARRFVREGHEVHVVTSDQRGGGNGWREWEVEGIHVHSLPVAYGNQMSFRRRLGAFLTFAARAGGRAARVRPDVVFATSTPLTIAVPAFWARLRSRAPITFEVRDLWPEMPIAVGALRNPVLRGAARLLERFAYRISTQVVALSPGMADGVVATGYPRERVTVVPNACDVEEFSVPEARGEELRRRLPWLGDRPLVVYCGTFGQVNRVDWLADVAAEMRGRSDAQVVAIGQGAHHDLVVQRGRELGVLDDNFHVLDAVPKREVPAVLSAADVVCSLFAPIPEMEVNSANKFFDALAAGRPVAVNYGGWQAELLREHAAGVQLPFADPRAAADRLVELLEDAPTRSEMGRAADELARTTFSRDALTATVLDVLVRARSEGRRR